MTFSCSRFREPDLPKRNEPEPELTGLDAEHVQAALLELAYDIDQARSVFEQKVRRLVELPTWAPVPQTLSRGRGVQQVDECYLWRELGSIIAYCELLAKSYGEK